MAMTASASSAIPSFVARIERILLAAGETPAGKSVGGFTIQPLVDGAMVGWQSSRRLQLNARRRHFLRSYRATLRAARIEARFVHHGNQPVIACFTSDWG